ncbi:MAG: hypothetical protein ACRD2Z_06445 [Thermoanaerobaculia bacterium]
MTSHPIPYYDLMRQSNDPRFLRLRTVRFAQEHGIQPTARAFSVQRKKASGRSDVIAALSTPSVRE